MKVKPSKGEYNEWLTYEFTDRKPDKATVALKWEELQVPFTITVDNATDLHMAAHPQRAAQLPGLQLAELGRAAAQYALQDKRPNDALEFAEAAVNRQFIGVENFQTLNTLAAGAGSGRKDRGVEGHARARRSATTPPGRSISISTGASSSAGKKEEALKVWELNAKRQPNTWPVNVGLARGYSAVGRYKDALKYAKARARAGARRGEQEDPGGGDQEARSGEGHERLRRFRSAAARQRAAPHSEDFTYLRRRASRVGERPVLTCIGTALCNFCQSPQVRKGHGAGLRP